MCLCPFFKALILVFLFGVALLFFSGQIAFAQEDREIIEEPKNEEVYHPHYNRDNKKKNSYQNTDSSTNIHRLNSVNAKKPIDLKPTEPEVNKNENEAMSTLSFNLFLYVLDRFKEE